MHNYSVIWGYAGRIIVRYVNFYRVLALRGICKIFAHRIPHFANIKLCDILKNVPKRTNEEIFVGTDYRPFILAEGIFDFMIDQYFLVLTTIDLFVLTFMCILTKMSETLNSKQKRGFFLAFVLIGVISILEVITILVDGGFRTGLDVFKALALGADGVLIGRPLALAAVGGGKEGVRLTLDKIRSELRETMIMSGCSTIAEITRSHVHVD